MDIKISYESQNNWKYPWLKEVIQLSLEYLLLDGLQDAKRSPEIPNEIQKIILESTNQL